MTGPESLEATTHREQADAVSVAVVADAAQEGYSDKFSQSDHVALGISGASLQDDVSGSVNAFAGDGLPSQVIKTQNAALKPFVGRWRLEVAGNKSAGSSNAYPGDSSVCHVVLEGARVDYGFKASGSSACPTSLFMLDSWVPYENRLVLRDHMGDEIMKATSRAPGMWIGTSAQGTTYILRKS